MIDSHAHILKEYYDDIDSLVKLANIYQVTLDTLTGSDKRNECIELLNIISNMNEDKRSKLLNFLKVTV